EHGRPCFAAPGGGQPCNEFGYTTRKDPALTTTSISVWSQSPHTRHTTRVGLMRSGTRYSSDV
ncbi:MAG: hypothetical protein JW940_19485, partial [Polyangiaceae bacterium]|nr:hypothetical protein [Polyangiaceae bacterium]